MVVQLTQEQKDAGWQVKKLGEIFEVKHGFAFKGENFSEDISLPIVVTPGNFAIGGGYKEAKPKNYVGEYPAEYQFDPGDFMVTMTDLSKMGDTLGNPAKVPADGRSYLHNQRIGKVIFHGNDVNTDFIFFRMMCSDYRQHVLSTASGSTVRHTSPNKIKEFEFLLPPLNEQKRVAEILGSVDDKIEANSRLIQNVEELADLTFDRYLEDLSEVLEDTTYGSLNFFGGGTPNTKTPDYWDGEVNWVTPTDVTSLKSHTLFESSRKITEAGLAACSSKLHPAGSIMMTSRATIGKFAVNQVPAATNQGFIVVQPANEYERWWIYHSMKKDVELFLLLANGATFLELSRRVFKDIPLKMFRGETELPAIHNQIIALEAEKKSLVETRNLLIRHLIG